MITSHLVCLLLLSSSCLAGLAYSYTKLLPLPFSIAFILLALVYTHSIFREAYYIYKELLSV